MPRHHNCFYLSIRPTNVHSAAEIHPGKQQRKEDEGHEREIDRQSARGRTVRNPPQRAPRLSMGRLVRRTEPHQRERRQHHHPRPGRRPGRAAWLAPESPGPRAAPGLGHSRRPRPTRCAHHRASITGQPKETDMTITAQPIRTTATKRVPMTSLRKTALVAGALYLLTFVSIPTLALYGPVRDPNFVVGPGPDTPVMIVGILEMIVALAGIGTAVVLYPVVKRQNEALALGFVGVRVLEAATIFGCVVSLLSIVTLRKDGAGADALVTGQALVAFHDWIFLLGQGFIPAVNALLLGSLLYRSRLVPRVLPLLGFIGAPLLVVSATATLFDLWGQVSTLSALLTIPIAVWEFSLGVYLVVKGFKPSPI